MNKRHLKTEQPEASCTPVLTTWPVMKQSLIQTSAFSETIPAAVRGLSIKPAPGRQQVSLGGSQHPGPPVPIRRVSGGNVSTFFLYGVVLTQCRGQLHLGDTSSLGEPPSSSLVPLAQPRTSYARAPGKAGSSRRRWACSAGRDFSPPPPLRALL